MSDLQIRQANEHDAAAVGAIMEAVWPENPPNVDRITRVVNDHHHAILVGMVGGRVVGFVDGFITETADSAARWEIDLLAVQPAFQRRGIASALVEACTQAAIERRVVLARGLVAVGNTGSERAFSRCGYTTDGVVHELLVASKDGIPPLSDAVDVMPHIITVHTLNYSGLWVEGQRTKTGLAVALSRLAATPVDVAGAVIAESETVLIDDAVAVAFEKVGRYQWWQRHLKLE